MDGVISDTQKWHARIESKLLEEVGIQITPEAITQKYAGVEDIRWFKEVFDKEGIKKDPAQILSRKWELIEELVSSEGVPPVDGSQALVKALHEDGFVLAVASSSPLSFIKIVIKHLELENYFSALTSADEVEKGKPAPDIFLLSAKRIGSLPNDSVVIEDGRSGIIGAKAAQMKAIGLVPNMNESDFPADLLVESLNELSPQVIENLVAS